MLTPDTTPDALRTALEAKLPAQARTWLDAALRAAAASGAAASGVGSGGVGSAVVGSAGTGSVGAGSAGTGSAGTGSAGTGTGGSAPAGGASADIASAAAGPADSASPSAAAPGRDAKQADTGAPCASAPTAAHLPPGSPPTPTLPVWERHFAAARRRCGQDAADAARVLLLHAARADAATAARLYERGDAAERRAVLTALPHLGLGPGALALVEDALRTNDTRLIAAALGPYAAGHLDPHGWRQAVLKCLFTGVPVDGIAGLADRARGDAELARMLTDYAAEREAADRPVPADLHRVLDLAGPPDRRSHPHRPRGDQGEES